MGFKTTGMIIAFVLLVPVIFAIIATFPLLQKTGVTIAQAFAAEVGLLSNPVIIVSALALFCYIGLEVSMGGWVTSYATEQGFTEKGASFVLSMFWIGLMAARLIASQSVNPANGVMAITILALVAAIAIALMVATKSKGLAGLFTVIAGFCFGPLFPTIVGVTFSKIDPSLYGSAFGIIFAVGLLGGTTIPAAIGYYSKGKSIRQSLPIAVATALVLCAIAVIMGRV